MPCPPGVRDSSNLPEGRTLLNNNFPFDIIQPAERLSLESSPPPALGNSPAA